MARVTVTYTDDLEHGTFEMKADPPMASLADRIKRHGVASLSPAEYVAMSAFAHVMRTAESTTERPSIILPDRW